MGLFKSNTDPSPGGGKSAGGPDPMASVVDSRVSARPAPGDRSAEIDLTRIMLQGVPANGQIEAVKPAATQINLQPTFVVNLLVSPADKQPYAVRVTQPVAEEYVERVFVGGAVRVKCDPDDPDLVWIDWAGSPDPSAP